jgi:hypothetical protein
VSIDIVTLVVSFIATAVSLYALFQSSRYRKTALEQRLYDQRNSINAAFADYGVRGPFATILKIPEAELSEYIPKICLLNMQINLLNDIFRNKESFEPGIFEAHENWARSILRPWIEGDAHLSATMELIYSSNDILEKSFVNWLKKLLPTQPLPVSQT